MGLTVVAEEVPAADWAVCFPSSVVDLPRQPAAQPPLLACQPFPLRPTLHERPPRVPLSRTMSPPSSLESRVRSIPFPTQRTSNSSFAKRSSIRALRLRAAPAPILRRMLSYWAQFLRSSKCADATATTRSIFLAWRGASANAPHERGMRK